MRKTCLNSVYDLARRDDRVIFIGSDLGVSTLDEFKNNIPERFFMEGISEQHIIGMAAGLAMEGNIPYVNTISVFLTRRCFEQIVLDLCLHNLNVRLIGNGGGLVYAPLGPTHLAVEDIAILRTIPNMTILAPADAKEIARLMELTIEHDGPVYIRLAKGGDHIVTPDDQEYKIGKSIRVREGKDILIITTGVTLQISLDAARSLASKGVEAGILHIHTIKPLDTKAIIERLAEVPALITVEEGTVIGGLGSSVAEIVAEADFGQPKKFKRIGVPDTFSDNFGSQKELMEGFGITAANVAQTALELIDVKSG
ncbi:MAG TPA: transketolase [Nitrospirae bacterium]|nr:transketolase [Nitrospirota bacterium]